MEHEFDIITLENNKDYVLTDEIVHNDITYFTLTNLDDEEDIKIRKVVNDKLTKIDDINEIKEVLEKF